MLKTKIGSLKSKSAQAAQLSSSLLFLISALACTPTNFSATKATVAASGSQGVTPPVTAPPSSGSSSSGSGSAPVSCTPVASITRLTKILFLMDTTGSNAQWIDLTTDTQCTTPNNVGCVPPTDPNKSFRLGSIQSFWNQYSSKTNFQWGFITFAADATDDYVGDISSGSFTSNKNTFQTVLNNFSQSTDDGDTPYGLALDAAASAILNDPDRGTAANPQYYVIMLTDGYPTDFTTPTAATSFINSMLATAPNQVTLSTVFYGTQNAPSSASAISMLTGMAGLGNGQFMNVNNPASGINISSVIPGHSCP